MQALAERLANQEKVKAATQRAFIAQTELEAVRARFAAALQELDQLGEAHTWLRESFGLTASELRQLLALDDEVAEADDVGMPQGLQDGTLLDEPPHQVAVGGVLRVEELGGHAFARAQVGGGPDRTRGALPDLLDQTVRGTQGVVELLTDHLPPPAPTRRSAGTQPIIHARRTAPRSAPPWPDGPASVPRVR